MLRCNIDTNCGLLNGALGTVLSVKHNKVTVKFDHVSVPYGVKRVMVMRNLYVYREQFPLILVYAVIIHKCQGLSLDCANVDLSENVFSAGMALSRVRTLSGLHLIVFDPASIKVSTQCSKQTERNIQKRSSPIHNTSCEWQNKMWGCPEKESLQMCVRVRIQQRSLP